MAKEIPESYLIPREEYRKELVDALRDVVPTLEALADWASVKDKFVPLVAEEGGPEAMESDATAFGLEALLKNLEKVLNNPDGQRTAFCQMLALVRIPEPEKTAELEDVRGPETWFYWNDQGTMKFAPLPDDGIWEWTETDPRASGGAVTQTVTEDKTAQGAAVSDPVDYTYNPGWLMGTMGGKWVYRQKQAGYTADALAQYPEQWTETQPPARVEGAPAAEPVLQRVQDAGYSDITEFTDTVRQILKGWGQAPPPDLQNRVKAEIQRSHIST
ncbi:hypothetical protein [Streptomyces sp. NPDC048419]|uniref:hypothetical protein n=1 Tax=Streptomyces sp. NPDC048419 TaxID=3365547 RepID=UPI00371B6A0A